MGSYAPATIEFKSHEIEELDPITGKIIQTHVIYPIIREKEQENVCISVPPLSEIKGELNSLVPTPSAIKSVDSSTSTTTTPRGPPTPLPTPSTDRVTPLPAVEPARDIADSDDVRSSLPRTPTPPRWIPLTALMPTSSPVRDFRSSREETPVGLKADLSATTRLSLVSPQPTSPSLPRTSPRDSLLDKGCEGEEGQFDDAEEDEPCTPQRLHPSEQPLPPSPSPSPMPSPVPSQVN